MPGKRASEHADFVTPRRAYRESLVAVDSVGPEDPSIPELDTRGGPSAAVGLGQGDTAQYGRNAQLNLAVIVEGFTSATLEVWLKGEVEQQELIVGSSSSSAPLTLPATEDWVKVTSKVFTASELWTIKDGPPGKYKIKLFAVAGSGNVHIREQHAA
jgi:hypothetical protein